MPCPQPSSDQTPHNRNSGRSKGRARKGFLAGAGLGNTEKESKTWRTSCPPMQPPQSRPRTDVCGLIDTCACVCAARVSTARSSGLLFRGGGRRTSTHAPQLGAHPQQRSAEYVAAGEQLPLSTGRPKIGRKKIHAREQIAFGRAVRGSSGCAVGPCIAIFTPLLVHARTSVGADVFRSGRIPIRTPVPASVRAVPAVGRRPDRCEKATPRRETLRQETRPRPLVART